MVQRWLPPLLASRQVRQDASSSESPVHNSSLSGHVLTTEQSRLLNWPAEGRAGAKLGAGFPTYCRAAANAARSE